MEISSKNMAALKYASNDESLSVELFEKLTKLIFDSFLIDFKIGKLNPKLETKKLGIKLKTFRLKMGINFYLNYKKIILKYKKRN